MVIRNSKRITELKKIEKTEESIKKSEQLGLFMYDIQANVSFTAFMTAVATFFIGMIFTQYDVFDNTIRVPILFLIISAFGFLYSTLIYSNSGGEISHRNDKNYEKFGFLGNILSEFCGVYMLVLAIPLAIVTISDDIFLRIAVLIVTMGGFFLYHVSKFAIITRYFKKGHTVISLIFILLAVSLFLSQIYLPDYLVYLAVITLIFIFGIIAYLINKRKVIWWSDISL